MANTQFMQELMSKLAELNIGSYLTTPDEQKRFKRTVLDVVNYSPKLQECPVDSIIECAVKGATLKLGLNKHFNMVPRKERGVLKARFELNYQGYVTLLERSAIVARANVVYDNDTFDIDFATEQISHKPYLRGSRGKPIGVYAIINIDKYKVIDYMNWQEIEKFKEKYLAFESDAWKNSPTEMAKKTILKRTAKPYLHLDAADDTVAEATALDNSTETQDGLTLAVSRPAPLLDTSKITVDVSTLPAPKAEIKAEMPKVDSTAIKQEVKSKKQATEKQIKRLFGILNNAMPKEEVQIYLESIKTNYGLDSINDLNMTQYDEVCELLEKTKTEEPENSDPAFFETQPTYTAV